MISLTDYFHSAVGSNLSRAIYRQRLEGIAVGLDGAPLQLDEGAFENVSNRMAKWIVYEKNKFPRFISREQEEYCEKNFSVQRDAILDAKRVLRDFMNREDSGSTVAHDLREYCMN